MRPADPARSAAENKCRFISPIAVVLLPFPARPSCCCSHNWDVKPQRFSLPAPPARPGLLPCSGRQLFAAGAGAPSLSAPDCLPAASFHPSAGSARAAASPPEHKHARYSRRWGARPPPIPRCPGLCCVGSAATWLSWVVC